MITLGVSSYPIVTFNFRVSTWCQKEYELMILKVRETLDFAISNNDKIKFFIIGNPELDKDPAPMRIWIWALRDLLKLHSRIKKGLRCTGIYVPTPKCDELITWILKQYPKADDRPIKMFKDMQQASTWLAKV